MNGAISIFFIYIEAIYSLDKPQNKTTSTYRENLSGSSSYYLGIISFQAWLTVFEVAMLHQCLCIDRAIRVLHMLVELKNSTVKDA